MISSDSSVADLLKQGIAAAKAGEEVQARQLLSRLVEQDERNVTAWLWLSSVVDNFADLEVCLENAATLQPQNELIGQRLAWVKQQQAAVLPPLVEESAAPPAREAAKAELVTRPALVPDQPGQLEVQRQFICPKCAGRLRFNPEIVDLQCQACGYIEVVDEISARPPERVLNAVLRTQRGYRWASVERMLRCQQCGAQTIFPPAQTSVSCPYCGNAVFGTAPEDQELETPQALIPMSLEADAARQKVTTWLGRGWLAPGDLTRAMLHGLQPVYLPLWLFNAAVTLYPAGHDKQVYLYANWAVSGIRSLPTRLIKNLGEVVMKNLIEFKPEYLAGWPASTYDVSAAIAALQAEREMKADAQARMPLGRAFSPAGFSAESFWLILFPIWISSYTYRGKLYRVLVNGETGQVAGDKPFSWIKALAMAAAISAVLSLLGFVLLRTLSALSFPPEWIATLQPILDTLQPAGFLLLPGIVMLIIIVVIAFRD
ncbi:hypothetical protein TFLX_02507 [Thermoflexales bacterium]|nr:hypothetical protein TFLX_02507 [Thermoflexales bacterium]